MLHNAVFLARLQLVLGFWVNEQSQSIVSCKQKSNQYENYSNQYSMRESWYCVTTEGITTLQVTKQIVPV